MPPEQGMDQREAGWQEKFVEQIRMMDHDEAVAALAKKSMWTVVEQDPEGLYGSIANEIQGAETLNEAVQKYEAAFPKPEPEEKTHRGFWDGFGKKKTE